MRITHIDPEFTGTEVIDTVAYEFADGVATVDELRADRAAALGQMGFVVELAQSINDQAAAEVPHVPAPREIGDDVPDDEMEKPEPEIGSE